MSRGSAAKEISNSYLSIRNMHTGGKAKDYMLCKGTKKGGASVSGCVGCSSLAV